MKKITLIRSSLLNVIIISAIGVFVGFSLSILNPFTGFAGIIGLFVLFQIFKEPEIGIYACLAYIPLHLFLMTQPFAADIEVGPFFLFGAIKDGLLFLIFFIGVLRLLYKKGNRIYYSKINTPLYIFLFIGALHLLTSDVLFLGVSAYRYWAEFSVIFFLTPLMIYKQKHIKPIFPLIILGGVSALVVGTYQYFTVERYIHPLKSGAYFYAGRLTSFFGDFTTGNVYGTYVGIILICCLSFLFFGSLSKRIRILLITIIPIALINIFFTFSRRSVLGLAVVLLFYLWFGRRKPFYVILVALFASGIIFFSPLVAERLQTISQLYEPSVYVKFEEWGWQLNRWLEHPLWGVGLGAVGPASVLFEIRGQANVHNSYLVILVQIGLFGLAAFLWFLYKIIGFGMSLINQMDASPLKPYLFATLGCLLFLLVVSFFGCSLDTYPFSLFFWFFAGLLVSIGRIGIPVRRTK